VALCGGAGSEFYREAWRAGCDAFVTGDVKYHIFIECEELGLAIIDAGHGHTELPGVRALHGKLAEVLRGVKVLMSEAEDNLVKRA